MHKPDISPFLWGPPGVGKSDGVKELAKKLEDNTGKKITVTDIRLLLFSPIDLRGVPIADESRTFTDWLKPRILDLDPSKERVNILFLDELSAAPQSVQAAAYQLTLNRAIGEHRLPDNTIVMAAGNRVTDRAVAYKMPSALANRMMHFDIEADFDSWLRWAIDEGSINTAVLGYLSFDRSKLITEEQKLDDIAFPTPRSWMFVSNIINTAGDISNIGELKALIAGCIGMGTALEFIAWCRVYKDLPRTEDIFAGKVSNVPKNSDAVYALISSITTYVVSKEKEGSSDRLTNDEVENLCAFCSLLPTDFALNFYINILGIESLNLKFMKSHSFMAWKNKHYRALAAAGLGI